MKNKFLQTIILLCFILPLNIFAADDTAVNQFIGLMKKFQTMQANFTQSSYDNTGNLIQKSTGQMSLQRPNKFRWDVQTPNKQLLIADGKYLWIYDVDLAQASKQELKTAQTTNPASLLSGSLDDIQQKFTITSIKNKKGIPSFQLKPNGQNPSFRSIEFDFPNNTLSQVRINDNLSQLTTINFSNVKINISIDSSLFNFQPPKGVDIVLNQ